MQFTRQISAALEVLRAQCSQTPLLELRFGTFTYGQFQPGIDQQEFLRIKSKLDLSYPPSEEVLTLESAGNIRKVMGEKLEWIRKDTLSTTPNTELGFQVVASCKSSIDPPTSFRSRYSRVLTRSTYLLSGSEVVLTIVCCTDQKQQQYEIELRTSELYSEEQFLQDLLRVLKLVQGTHEIYSLKERQSLLKFVDSKFVTLQQPRILRYRDLVYGGIVGNSTTGYMVNFRPEGVRKFLIVFDSKLWLYFPGEAHLNLIARVGKSEYEQTILDGTVFQGNGVHFNFLVQDAVWVFGENIGNLPDYRKRMAQAQLAKDRIQTLVGPPLLNIATQTSLGLNSSELFFRTLQKRWEERFYVPYQVKGFTFIPANMPRTFPVQKGKPRNLSQQPDLVDWYPEQELSLDLRLAQTATGSELQDRSGQVFQGSQINPLPELARIDHPTGTLVRMKLDQGQLVLDALRTDKIQANSTLRAREIWDSMHDPISIEDLTGETLELLKKYQARERRGLYKNLSGTLLVLNAGHGRDLPAWKNFTRMVLVEPDPVQIEELNRRLDLFGLSSQARVIQAEAEQVLQYTNQITQFLGGLPQNLLMTEGVQIQPWLSTALSALVGSKGRVILMGMDTQKVAGVFTPFLAGPDSKSFKMGRYFFSNFTGTQFQLDLEGQVSLHQVVNWDQLIVTLDKAGFSQLELQTLDREKLLPVGDLRWTRFFLSLSMIRKEIKLELPPIEYLEPPVNRNPNPQQVLTSQQPQDLPELYFPQLPSNLIWVSLDQSVPSRGLAPLSVSDSDPDPVQPLPYAQTPTLVRIGTYPDNSLLHAVLLGIEPVYQDNPKYEYRSYYINNLRRDLGLFLTRRDPDFPGKTYFQSVWGSRADLRKIRSQINSDQPLGLDFLPYLTAVFGFDFIVIKADRRGIKVVYQTQEDLPILVLLQTGSHFELLGDNLTTSEAIKKVRTPQDLVGKNSWIQTYFEPTDRLPKQLI